MKILITGAKGFIAKNLIAELKNDKSNIIFEYDRATDFDLLDKFCEEAEFVFHLAGVNRTSEEEKFMEGNFGFTSLLLDTLKKHKNICPVMMSSSTQAELENSYGVSKKAGENLLMDFSGKMGAKVLIYRFPNVFGKWCRPNYNSVVATFCNNIANDIPISINDPNVIMNLVYIDDLVTELIYALNGKETKYGEFCEVSVVHTITLGAIAELIYSFKASRSDCMIPNMSLQFTKNLYSTYLSYLPKNDFSYKLKMNINEKGSFTEFVKSEGQGQVSVNVSKPGVIKGNHWHHTKTEKFLVVAGKGVIRFRKLNTDEILEYFVSCDKMEVVDIPPGYTHNLENLGDGDMITVMWANELYDSSNPDTYYMEV